MRNIVFAFLFLVFSPVIFADNHTDVDIPEPLSPWVDWVMYGQQATSCPHAYNNAKSRFCAWPAKLNIEINRSNGRFSQDWELFDEAWIVLPGDVDHWPMNVTANGQPVVVTERFSRPAVRLGTGSQKIAGEFAWQNIPESLSIPVNTGLISITREGEPVLSPRINDGGQLWLDSSQQADEVQDTMELQVYRKIIDQHPMQVQTRLVMQVSGQSRDINFDSVMLDGFLPLQLQSQLPARVNRNGDLEVQVRLGTWQVDLFAYHPEMIESLSLPALDSEWQAQEVWVFQADPSLRLAEVSGVPGVDARQTRLPQEWQQLPAYLVEPGATMILATMQRGSVDGDTNTNVLDLARSMWLDFDGDGFTFQDVIMGSMKKDWRLSMGENIQLGSARVNGQPQFVTTLDDGTEKGVEIRQGNIHLTADSRFTDSITTIPATGWQQEFRRVETSLYLPPGWKLFSARGADSVSSTWVKQWTLLDLFIVLVIAVAIGRLWDWRWGALALLTVSLIWHEVGAPRYIWIHLVIAVALLRYLPAGKFRLSATWYRNIVLFALVLITIPFVTNQIKNGLFPQLNTQSNYTTSMFDMFSDSQGFSASAPRPVPQIMRPDAEMDEAARAVGEAAARENAYEVLEEQQQTYSSGALSLPSRKAQKRKKILANQMVDPNANIQTGPGLPDWNWQRVSFTWNSPVSAEQKLRLVFIPPFINFILNLLRVALVLLLISRLVSMVIPNSNGGGNGNFWRKLFPKSVATVILLCLIGPVAAAQDSDHFPDKELLQELKTRLMKPAVCLPRCADIEQMRIDLNQDSLLIRLKVHVAETTTVPLPGNNKQWRPDQVLVNGNLASALYHDPQGVLWIALESGVQEIILEGRVVSQSAISLALPLRPRSVVWSGEGWSVEGIKKNNVPSQQLQLIRARVADPDVATTEGADENYLVPLIEVERTLHLGLEWSVDTTVRRKSAVGTPINMAVPLLPGEAVMSNDYLVEDQSIAITLSSGQSQVSWESQIPIADSMTLTATDLPGVIEKWRLDISPVWHAKISGIPQIHRTQPSTEWLPEWRPWPGESVALNVQRPAGIDGRTVTIDSSELRTSMGSRSSESNLSFVLRSSRGGQHVIGIPEGAKLIDVTINGSSNPVRQAVGKVTIPISPGSQNVTMNWRSDRELSFVSSSDSVDLGLESVNSRIHVNFPQNRWILWTGGPQMGPVVLFWFLLAAILLGAFILGRFVPDSPLKIWQWFLLGVGLSLASPLMIVIVVAWLLAIHFRPGLSNIKNRLVFNLAQVVLVGLTVLAAITLFSTLKQGLLGYPEMQIAGNWSYATDLKWYQDRITQFLPEASVYSVPLYVYRIFMLLWSLWLAFSMIEWVVKGWQNFSEGGFWRQKTRLATADPNQE